MLDTVLKIANIIGIAVNAFAKIVEMLRKAKEKHQKTTAPDQR